MKNILFLVFISLVAFNSCIKDDNNCFRVIYGLVSPDAEGDAPVDLNRYSANDIVTVLDTDAARPGFNFTGWNTQADGSGDAYQPGETFIITRNVALYAQWEESAVTTYGVVYIANGGDGSHTDADLTPGQEYTILSPDEAEISRSGYGFTEWNTAVDGSGTAYLPEEVITVQRDVTLYAQWAEEFNVVYDANEGLGGIVRNIALYGQPYTLLTSAQSGISRPDYVLRSWNTWFDGSGTSYAPGDVIFPTEDMILFAQWEALPQFTIIYNPGVGDGGTQVTLPQGTPHTILTEAQANVIYPLFTLVSWNTELDGSGIPYPVGSVTIVTENLTLYAQWVF